MRSLATAGVSAIVSGSSIVGALEGCSPATQQQRCVNRDHQPTERPTDVPEESG